MAGKNLWLTAMIVITFTMSASSAINIPLLNNETERIVLYRDELPVVDDLLDALRAEFAPLDVWRKCAVSLDFIVD